MNLSELFQINGEDITKLRDDELRELVGLLCEADYRAAGLRTTGITWGGHQDAADGGLDVVVRDSIPPPMKSFIPRSYTGFQVKMPAMSASEILTEMKPRGVLRDSINELIIGHGAYIIVSSKASTTDTALIKRKEAMLEAVSEIGDYTNLYLDFYTCDRIASWVRSYPGLILWIREKIGVPLNGWKPYGNWSGSPQGLDDDYLLDEGLRLYHGTSTGDKGENSSDGLMYLRSILSQPKACVRLTGLSGVGKTRFVQALFDGRIGQHAIDPSRAIYTDFADSPTPNPVSVANLLIQEHSQSILIVDNCMPDLHKRLKDVCSSADSTIGLLTVEYDVRDDLPEGTDILRLEPASELLINKLIQRQFPHIGQVDAQTIADFSGGNARVAIAIASTVNQGETIGHLRDEDLFKRLFQQRNNSDESLLECAEVLSLVYSFNGADLESEKSEIKVLANIIEQPINQLYRSVSLLRDRKLIQGRDVWRAVLPHAIANRLAQNALKTIPKKKILDAFMVEGNERLLKSFTRRLSYLHDNEIAKEIAAKWLEPGGWIGEANSNLNQLGIDILINIAPVVPERVVELFECWAKGSEGAKFTDHKNKHAKEYIRLLRHIAYDSALFARCALLISYFALAEDPQEKQDSAKNVLKSLFFIHLSGTHAPAEARVQIIKELWNKEQEAQQEMALLLLDAGLEVWHFYPHHEFNFGARPRNYGWQPKNNAEQVHWYETYLQVALEFAFTKSLKAQKVRKLLAKRFRGLWTGANMYLELEILSEKMLQLCAWNEGWIAVREVLKYDSDKQQAEVTERLQKIEETLKPANLEEMARTYAFSDSILILEYDQDDVDHTTRLTRAEKTTEDLGRKIATDPEIFSNLLPEMVKATNQLSVSFGKGLADGSLNKIQLWKAVRAAYDSVPKEQISISALFGILSSPAMDEVREEIMDSLVTDSIFGKYFPIIQTAVPITQHSLERLCLALDEGIAPTRMFQNIAYGRSHETIGDDDLVAYLKKILTREDGVDVVIEILSMRFHSQERHHSESILEITREVLVNYRFNRDNSANIHHIDYQLADLADKCLGSQEAKNATSKICRTLANSISTYDVFIHDFPLLLGKLALLQPIIFLDEFLSPQVVKNHRLKSLFSDDFIADRNPISNIGEDDIFYWCEIDAARRFPQIASVIHTFVPSSNEATISWSPLVMKLFEKAPDISEVLDSININLLPHVYHGSAGDIISRRAKVFCTLFPHENNTISIWAKEKYENALTAARDAQERDAYDFKRVKSFE